MDRNNCNHNWKIHVGAKHQINASFPAIYICENCGLTMEASDVIQLRIVDSMNRLQESIIILQKQIPITGSEIRTIMSKSAEKLSNSIDKFKNELKEYSESSNKHTNAIKWLTGGLVFVGSVQIIVILILNFK